MSETTSKALVWDKSGERIYETGVKQCALYLQDSNGAYPLGVAWNGISKVSESPSGAEATAIYADDTKYLDLISNEEFGATIEAYTYPDEFAVCDGSASLSEGIMVGQQSRKAFGLAYKTTVGNDIDGNDYGYKLHLIYGAKAKPSSRDYSTINDSPEAITFSWEISTTPVTIGKIGDVTYKPTASITIDSKKVGATKMKAIEDALYGTENTDPYLPLPSALLALIAE